jgi:hypothetical protein
VAAVSAGAGRILGDDYDLRRGFERVVRIDVIDASAPPPPDGRPVARMTYRAPDGSHRAVTATLLAQASASKSRDR